MDGTQAEAAARWARLVVVRAGAGTGAADGGGLGEGTTFVEKKAEEILAGWAPHPVFREAVKFLLVKGTWK